jgi:hypothetical protein
LRLSKGEFVAMTEDQGVPADDWVQQMILACERPYDVIGGAIENGIDRLLNRALYFCDFGRYGRPFENREVAYLSDVNLAYKRQALMEIKELWWEEYHETTVNWALRSRGKKLFLDGGPVVYECRPPISLWSVAKERITWGRLFAETRAQNLNPFRRALLAAGTWPLPVLLLFRAIGNMSRQGRNVTNILSTMPLILSLVILWSFGEMLGYFTGRKEPVSPIVTDSFANDASLLTQISTKKLNGDPLG